MLEVIGISVGYGAIEALHDVSLLVAEGEIVTAIGANGAGKSTLLMTVSGVLRPRSGTVRFLGRRIDGMAPFAIVEAGICQVPEGRRVFPQLTVEENLRAGAYIRPASAEVAKDRDWLYGLFPRLAERSGQLAGTLSGGEQQMLAIGRGLMARPKLLLLDEPSMGLAPMMVLTIFSILREISRRGVTILLVEQNAHMALELASRGYVLEGGRIVLTGPSAELARSSTVKEAYLGRANAPARKTDSLELSVASKELEKTDD